MKKKASGLSAKQHTTSKAYPRSKTIRFLRLRSTLMRVASVSGYQRDLSPSPASLHPVLNDGSEGLVFGRTRLSIKYSPNVLRGHVKTVNLLGQISHIDISAVKDRLPHSSHVIIQLEQKDPFGQVFSGHTKARNCSACERFNKYGWALFRGHQPLPHLRHKPGFAAWITEGAQVPHLGNIGRLSLSVKLFQE